MPLRLTVGVSKQLGVRRTPASAQLQHRASRSSRGSSSPASTTSTSKCVRRTTPRNLQSTTSWRGSRPPATCRPAIPAVTVNGDGRRNGSNAHPNDTPVSDTGPRGGTNGTRVRTTRPAPAQVKAIHAIARSRQVDLRGLLRHAYGVDHAEDLSVPDAGKLIDQLKRSGHS